MLGPVGIGWDHVGTSWDQLGSCWDRLGSMQAGKKDSKQILCYYGLGIQSLSFARCDLELPTYRLRLLTNLQ